jgi:hypothetical protein
MPCDGRLWPGMPRTGAPLVVYGQAYQTGADPYCLFLAWALAAADHRLPGLGGVGGAYPGADPGPGP